MQRIIIYIFFWLCSIGSLSAQPKYELRAVWLTTIGGLDWPHSYAHDASSIRRQQQELCQILDQLKRANINTVLLQTRVRGTTIYPSAFEPYDGCLSGQPGKSPGYDALQFAINECHKRGMELHAWVVTIPIGKWNKLGCRRLRATHPSMLKRIGEEGYMNPESPLTADYLAMICDEITSKYDIDGIHLDYIRYPETWGGRVNHHTARAHITNIVRTIHQRVKRRKPWVKLSCSPIGKFDDLSRYRSYGWNAYSRVYQDAQGWMREGLMDQLYPMMYFRGEQFFPFALDWSENSYGRSVSAGLGIYMLSPREKNWDLAVIKREMAVARQIGLGHTYFRSKFFTDNVKGIYDFALLFDAYPALAPPMSRAGALAPLAPTQLTVQENAAGTLLTWNDGTNRSGGSYLTYNIYMSETYPVDINDAANLIAVRHPSKSISIRRTPNGRPVFYAVTAIDRYGIESAALQSQQPKAQATFSSPLIANDGRQLQIPQHLGATDAEYVAVFSMQGNIVKTLHYGPTADISSLPEGVYVLKTLDRKGITHRLGQFIVKRHQ